MSFSVQKQKYDIEFTTQFDVNGGDYISETEKTYVVGEKYGSFPSVSKSGYVPAGWFTASSGGNKVTGTSLASAMVTKLYAQWTAMTNYTAFNVTTTSSYKTFGFYSLTKKSASESVFVDWGDGTIEELTSYSQQYHTYSSVGSFVVKVSDDITQFCLQNNSSTYYVKNQYTFKSIASWSTSLSTSLPAYCFYYCGAMTSLQNLTSVTSIGTYCFSHCTSLTSFTGLGNITSLASYSFEYCTGITSFATLPTTVTSYQSYCVQYSGINNLARVRSTDTLNSYCFASTNSLTSLATLPARSSLPTQCFYSNQGLKVADMSNWTSMTYLNGYVFQYCQYLNTLKVPSTLTGMGSGICQQVSYGQLTADFSNSQLTSIPSYCFYYCYYLKEVKMPNTLKDIGPQAFSYCYRYLTSMQIPSALTSIGSYAFAGCNSLQNISCYAETAPTVYSNTFGNSSTGTNGYTGCSYASSGNNRLYVNNPSNYKTSYWSSVLLDSSKSNYKVTSYNPYSAESFDITGLSSSYRYTGSAITPEPTVKNNSGTTLTKGTHYSTAYGNNIECGTASLSVTGISPYYDTQVVNFTIYDPTKYWISVDCNSQWRTPPSAWTNTDTNYDIWESYSNYNVNNGYAKMYVNISGYTSFTLNINSYAESNYDYTIAFNPDNDVTSLPSYTTTGVLTSTYGYQYNPSTYQVSAGTGWRKVTYALDGGTHKIMICYRKDASSHANFDRGYLAINKDQYPPSFTIRTSDDYYYWKSEYYDSPVLKYTTLDGQTHTTALSVQSGTILCTGVTKMDFIWDQEEPDYNIVEYTHGDETSSIRGDTGFPGLTLTADVVISHVETMCLIKGTKITLADGTLKNIEDITYDDDLLVWNFDECKLDATKPLWLMNGMKTNYCHVAKYASGNELSTTGIKGHRNFDISKNSFEYVTDSIGDDVYSTGGIDRLVSCEKIYGQFEYYNVYTQRHLNCFANGVLTSGRLNNIGKIRDMRFREATTVFHSYADFSDIMTETEFNGLRIAENKSETEELRRYVVNMMRNKKER